MIFFNELILSLFNEQHGSITKVWMTFLSKYVKKACHVLHFLLYAIIFP